MFGMRLLLLSGIEFCRSCYVVMVATLLFRLLRRLCLCAFAYLYPVVLFVVDVCVVAITPWIWWMCAL